MIADDVILVTGANGFIGGWIVETLYLNGFRGMRAGINRWSGAARLARFPQNIVPCDILDPRQIAQAVSGTTCVIHCAQGSDEVIVQGTQNMLDAALKENIRRFVYLSSTEVYGDQAGEIDETYPFPNGGNSYAESKREAERLCWEYHKNGLPVTVIRPTIVYGPFSQTWTVEIAMKLQSGNWGIFENYGEGSCNLIYIADLVSGILLACQSEQAVGEAFNLSGPEVLTWNQYFQRFNLALGLPALKTIKSGNATLRASLMAPVRASAKFTLNHFKDQMRGLSSRYPLARRAMKLAEQRIKTTPRSTDFGLFSRQAVYSIRKAHDYLGATPEFDVDRGLDLSVRWLRHIGLAGE